MPIALAQCRGVITRLGLLRRVAVSDTALAPAGLARAAGPDPGGDRPGPGGASSTASRSWRRDIEDTHNNTTRFLVMTADA
jgi:prephenate dehydratase